MSVLTKKELQEMISRQDEPSISICMPTERMGREVQQNPIRLRNLTDEAQAQLEQNGLTAGKAAELLQPLRDMELDRVFWQQQSDSLAIFLTHGWMRRYQTPIDMDEQVVIGKRYHIKPLLPLVQRDGQFWILALDLNNVRLFQASRFSVHEIELVNVPTSQEEALRWDDSEQQLQWHTATPPSWGERSAMFHGHGGTADDQRTDILRFFQKLDNGLQEFFGDKQIPMVLAGVDHLLPIFREATAYSGLVDETITGSAKMMSAQELRDKAWKIVKPLFAQEHDDALKTFGDLSDTDQVSEDIHEIIPAALFSRIDTLFVARDTSLWGVFDPQTGEVEAHEDRQPGDEDLQNVAAIYTMFNGGKVFVLPVDELPGEQPVAATFRYSESNV